MEILKNILEVIMYAVITGALGYVVAEVGKVAHKKIDELQETTKLAEYDKLNMIIDKAQEVISNVVTAVSQTYVDSLKKAGKFDSAAQKEAKDQALGLAKDMITDETAEAIKKAYGNLDTYLDTKIEAVVNQLKK